MFLLAHAQQLSYHIILYTFLFFLFLVAEAGQIQLENMALYNNNNNINNNYQG